MKQLLIKMLPRFVAMATLGAVLTASQTSFAADGDVKAGQSKAAMCIGCHGIVGYQNVFPEVYKVPKISGQSANYIASALNAYKKGDRKHPTMRGMAGPLSEQDIADLSAFYAASGTLEAAPETPAAATEVVAALINKGGCVACHGANFSKPLDPSYPKLAGQHADYLYAALRSYNTQGNAVMGRNNAIMSGVTGQYSNAELKAIAGYLASLKGEMSTEPQSRFR
jgi:cytochrome c553